MLRPQPTQALYCDSGNYILRNMHFSPKPRKQNQATDPVSQIGRRRKLTPLNERGGDYPGHSCELTLIPCRLSDFVWRALECEGVAATQRSRGLHQVDRA